MQCCHLRSRFDVPVGVHVVAQKIGIDGWLRDDFFGFQWMILYWHITNNVGHGFQYWTSRTMSGSTNLFSMVARQERKRLSSMAARQERKTQLLSFAGTERVKVGAWFVAF